MSGILHILVVDGETAVADSLTMVLRVRGYAARAAYTAEAAIEMAEGFSPHVLICDVRLPGMSGFELANWFAAHQPACKLLLVSGHASASGVAEDEMGRSDHLYTFLSKPVHPMQVLEFVASCALES